MGNYLKTGDLFGLHYIYATLTNSDGGDPLGMPAIRQNPAEFEIVATNAVTGKAEYFDGKKMPQDDYRLIMASCALPAACRPVRYADSVYYDGGVADSVPLQRAMDRGCGKCVVILSKPRDFVMEPQQPRWFYTWKCRKYPEIIHLPMGTYAMDAKENQALYDLALADYDENREKLLDFLKGESA